MESEWSQTSLGDVLSFSNGKSSPERTNKGAYPVFGSNGLIGFSDQTNAGSNTIVIGRVGSYCGSLQFSKDACWVTDNAIIATARGENVSRFLLYLLERINLHQWRGGSGQPLLNQRTLNSISTKVPSPEDQRTIADILGTLDDKIELNRQMNRTLESMARAIFKAWFVDFEPVKAKAAGASSFRGMPQSVFDQLPDRFTDTELGPLPEGWEVETVGSQCYFNYGKALKAANRRAGVVPVYGSNGPVGHHDESLVSGPGIVVGRKGNPGTVIWVHSDFFPIDTTFYLTRKSDKSVNLSYLRYALDELRLGSHGSDSAVPGLNRNMAYSLHLIVPDTKTAGGFQALFLLYQERIYANARESGVLAALRDTLLPKLISGDLRAPVAEERADGG